MLYYGDIFLLKYKAVRQGQGMTSTKLKVGMSYFYNCYIRLQDILGIANACLLQGMKGGHNQKMTDLRIILGFFS